MEIKRYEGNPIITVKDVCPSRHTVEGFRCVSGHLYGIGFYYTSSVFSATSCRKATFPFTKGAFYDIKSSRRDSSSDSEETEIPSKRRLWSSGGRFRTKKSYTIFG